MDIKFGKIQITFKSPDATLDAVTSKAEGMFRASIDYNERAPTADERIYLSDLKNKIEEKISKFVQWSEYVTIEIDLDSGKANVLASGHD